MNPSMTRIDDPLHDREVGTRDSTLDTTRIVIRRSVVAGTGDRIRRALGVGRVVVQVDSTKLLDASVLLGSDFAPRLQFHP